jgi:hypothetical protein
MVAVSSGSAGQSAFRSVRLTDELVTDLDRCPRR